MNQIGNMHFGETIILASWISSARLIQMMCSGVLPASETSDGKRWGIGFVVFLDKRCPHWYKILDESVYFKIGFINVHGVLFIADTDIRLVTSIIFVKNPMHAIDY
jgi:hypothetical protein